MGIIWSFLLVAGKHIAAVAPIMRKCNANSYFGLFVSKLSVPLPCHIFMKGVEPPLRV